MLAPIVPSHSLQFCGKDLANALALVCAETGYNKPFRQDAFESHNEHRYPRDTGIRRKRGIVDECCRTACGWSTIETYCRPMPSSTTEENLQIRKRSDLSEDTSSNKQARTFSLTYSVGGPEDIRHRKRRLFGQSDDAIDRKKNRIFFSTTNDGNDGSDDNKTNSLPAFEDETSERWKMGGSGSGEMITYHDVDMTPHNESLDTEEIKAEVVRHDENFTKSFHGKGHHHRVNKFHHKDLRKGKVLIHSE
ncbi:Insulin [Nesidiocoris tenuis]|uniref:Insulin n=1 Tax=Nesidiocoris tenuis TaxID=355587 RepID=A0ABN7ACY9_9HEMI|nr:Insulin [Nesidiocoris tenuis]